MFVIITTLSVNMKERRETETMYSSLVVPYGLLIGLRRRQARGKPVESVQSFNEAAIFDHRDRSKPPRAYFVQRQYFVSGRARVVVHTCVCACVCSCALRQQNVGKRVE